MLAERRAVARDDRAQSYLLVTAIVRLQSRSPVNQLDGSVLQKLLVAGLAALISRLRRCSRILSSG